MRNLIRSAGAEVGSLIRDAGVEAGRTILGNELRQETRTGVVIGSGLAATGMGVASYAVHVLGRVIESIEQAASKSGGIDSTLIQTLARDKEMSPESVMTTLHALASWMEYLSDGLRYVAIFLILRTIGNLAYGQYEKYQEKKREQNSLMRDGAGI